MDPSAEAEELAREEDRLADTYRSMAVQAYDLGLVRHAWHYSVRAEQAKLRAQALREGR